MGPNYTRMELHDPAAVQPAKEKVSEIVDRLRQDGGGLVSIFYHPCEWIHLEFWDGVNFRRGANPPPDQWKAPPQRTRTETDAAFERFGQYIDHIRSLQGVRFVTAGELPSIYADAVRKGGAPEKDLAQIASRLAAEGTSNVDFMVIGNRSYSVADQFELLTTALRARDAGSAIQFPLPTKGLLGPDGAPPEQNERTHIDWPAFRMALADVANYIQTEGRVPARVFIGPDPIPTAVFLVGLARVYEFCQNHHQSPAEAGVELPRNIEVLPARHVAEDTPGLFGGWIIHKEGFRAPRILGVARLQAWTLKPAIRSEGE
jgi:hypothetical protein